MKCLQITSQLLIIISDLFKTCRQYSRSLTCKNQPAMGNASLNATICHNIIEIHNRAQYVANGKIVVIPVQYPLSFSLSVLE